MKLLLKIVLGIVILFFLVSGSGLLYLKSGLEAGAKLEVNPVDLSSIADGTYNGSHKAGRWTNEVSVTVKDHKITNIEIIKDVAIPKAEWTEKLIGMVMEKQNTDIDALSGSTVTGKAYLKAIENALSK